MHSLSRAPGNSWHSLTGSSLHYSHFLVSGSDGFVSKVFLCHMCICDEGGYTSKWPNVAQPQLTLESHGCFKKHRFPAPSQHNCIRFFVGGALAQLFFKTDSRVALG